MLGKLLCLFNLSCVCVCLSVLFFSGSPANSAGGEDEDGGDGRARGEERRAAGALQWPLRLFVPTGLCPGVLATELRACAPCSQWNS